ncbi:PPOX class probable F420-dependent enzyme, Rv0121 family [Nocardioides sp. YR527]|uniref:TIGR03668 family PPOX class F420-dependent oxidoreductase n=1 Tax=Nocardioides sp. YR527 TaxID=1881028 RepID=UPI00088042DF|nr:TIGR03668 family PPOX class F420-dependent oxidoreductase [Nocardioides sp. YR527]SDL31692.1 PPOX class probable F420-dependent enzyme, Rv0121 family [Nocardioides sp. YR527]
MRREEQWARERFADARVARLATVSADAAPRIVPIVFAVAGDVLVTAVDHKPKSTTRLRRLEDIAANPRVAVLVDRYDDDWDQLWWARADGVASVHETYDLAPLVAKYADYRERPPAGPVIAVEVTRWSGWSSQPGGT